MQFWCGRIDFLVRVVVFSLGCTCASEGTTSLQLACASECTTVIKKMIDTDSFSIRCTPFTCIAEPTVSEHEHCDNEIRMGETEKFAFLESSEDMDLLPGAIRVPREHEVLDWKMMCDEFQASLASRTEEGVIQRPHHQEVTDMGLLKVLARTPPTLLRPVSRDTGSLEDMKKLSKYDLYLRGSAAASDIETHFPHRSSSCSSLSSWREDTIFDWEDLGDVLNEVTETLDHGLDAEECARESPCSFREASCDFESLERERCEVGFDGDQTIPHIGEASLQLELSMSACRDEDQEIVHTASGYPDMEAIFKSATPLPSSSLQFEPRPKSPMRSPRPRLLTDDCERSQLVPPRSESPKGITSKRDTNKRGTKLCSPAQRTTDLPVSAKSRSKSMSMPRSSRPRMSRCRSLSSGSAVNRGHFGEPVRSTRDILMEEVHDESLDERLDLLILYGDVVVVAGGGHMSAIGAIGGLFGHVMLVTSTPRGYRRQTAEAAAFLEIWPGDALYVWEVRLLECTRAEAGLHEEHLLLYISARTGRIVVLGEINEEGEVVEYEYRENVEFLEIWQCPFDLRASTRIDLMESVVAEMKEHKGNWSWSTAMRALVLAPDLVRFGNNSDRTALFEQIQECWTAKPICTSVVIIFWQRYICKLVQGSVCAQSEMALDLILKWMPLKADRVLPGELCNTLRACQWHHIAYVPSWLIPRSVRFEGL